MTTYTYSIEAKPLLQALLAVEVSMPSRATECRVYLAGVRVELRPGLLELITTDGHRMGHASLPATCEVGGEYQPVQFTIEGADLKALILGMKDAAKSSLARCVWEFTPPPPAVEGDKANNYLPGELKLLSAGRTVIVRTMPRTDGTFPDWRRVMPTKSALEAAAATPCHQMALNNGYVQDAGKACGHIMKGDKYGRLYQTFVNGMAHFAATNGVLEFAHIVMAMRDAK